MPTAENPPKETMRWTASPKRASALENFNKGLTVKKPSGDEKKPSPPPLGRKAKAALAFAQSAMKASKADRLYSVRQLVNKGGQGTTMSRSHSMHIPRPRDDSITIREETEVGMIMVRGRPSPTHRHENEKTSGGPRNGEASTSSSPANSGAKLGRIKPPPVPSTARQSAIFRFRRIISHIRGYTAI